MVRINEMKLMTTHPSDVAVRNIMSPCSCRYRVVRVPVGSKAAAQVLVLALVPEQFRRELTLLSGRSDHRRLRGFAYRTSSIVFSSNHIISSITLRISTRDCLVDLR